MTRSSGLSRSCAPAKENESSSPSAERPGRRLTLRVAVRPERVRIAPVERHAPDGGSRLEGTIAEVVYLGMYTQFHVTTGAGRMVSNRLADELVAPLEVGCSVTLSLGAGAHVRALGFERSRCPLDLERPESSLSHTPADLGGYHDEQRDGDDDHCHRDHLRQLVREAKCGVEVDGERHVEPLTNEATAYSSNDVVKAMR